MSAVVGFTWSGKVVGINRRSMIAKNQRRIMTRPEYQQFVNSIAWRIVLQLAPDPPRLHGDVHVDYTFTSQHDCDAVEKPLLDALELSGVIENDRQVYSVHHRRPWKENRKADDELVVSVKEIEIE